MKMQLCRWVSRQVGGARPAQLITGAGSGVGAREEGAFTGLLAPWPIGSPGHKAFAGLTILSYLGLIYTIPPQTQENPR